MAEAATTATTGQTDTAPAAAESQSAPAASTVLTDGGQTQQAQPAAPAATDAATAAAAAIATEAAASTEKKPDDKPAEDDKQAAKPIEYADFTLPENYKLEGDAADRFKAWAKDRGLSQEQAQAVVDMDARRAVEAQQAQVQAVLQATHDWQQQTRADAELGGDKIDANIAIAKKALDAFGTPELKSLLRDSGLGNHPEIIRAFYRAGKAISEDSFVPAGTGATQGARDAASALYPSQK